MAKSGISRHVDELGRIVIPAEVRRALGIEERNPLEISVEGDTIVLKKSVPCCVFCGLPSEKRMFRGKQVCNACLLELKTGLH